ncbi:MAG: PilT/PilU family type 4a pilus ATPase, partial [Candidatus Eremiobacteraeota bacterium]|nr:PilT/PilU family type 4a pilus ATPase [Candidatus Eremiobacteraeota bacterium]
MTRAPSSLRLRDALEIGRRRNASDVHLQAGSPPILRIDGALEVTPESVMTRDELAEIVCARLSDAERTKLERQGDATAPWIDAELGTMRAHVYRGCEGYTIAVRLLDLGVPTLEALDLPEAVAHLAERDRGLVIVGGATGSGKSTTLAALVHRINTSRARRIVTVEDPIEYRHPNRRSLVTQREVGSDTPSFAAALVGALRADPDVIVVGELRDAAAMRVALTAAETGHLVLTTLHTGDAPQTVDRIVDAFAGDEAVRVRLQLAAVLEGVICQTLVRRPNGGRRAIVELLVSTDAVRNVIRDGKTHQLKN